MYIKRVMQMVCEGKEAPINFHSSGRERRALREGGPNKEEEFIEKEMDASIAVRIKQKGFFSLFSRLM